MKTNPSSNMYVRQSEESSKQQETCIRDTTFPLKK